ncbi:F-box domain-containing protein [Entamoeba marina]
MSTTNTKLENMFLKNVMFYLITDEDVVNFMLVSKNCALAITTAYINPYYLTNYLSFEKILDMFPSLETFYCVHCLQLMKKKQSKSLPLIEIGKWTSTERTINKVFSTVWFSSKIKRMTITRNVDCDMLQPKNFTQLQHLSVEFSAIHRSKNFSDFINLKTLKKCVIYSHYFLYSDVSKAIKCIKNDTCQYIFVVNCRNHKEQDYQKIFNEAKKRNIILFSSNTFPNLESGSFFSYPIPSYVDIDCKITEENAKELIQKHGFKSVSWKTPEISDNFFVDSPFEFLTSLRISHPKTSFILPQSLTSLDISETNKKGCDFDFSNLKLKRILLTNYIQNTPTRIDISNLEHFFFDGVKSNITYILDKEEFSNFPINNKCSVFIRNFDSFPIQIIKTDGSSKLIDRFLRFELRDGHFTLDRIKEPDMVVDLKGLKIKTCYLEKVKVKEILFDEPLEKIQVRSSKAQLIEVGDVVQFVNKNSFLDQLKYKNIQVLDSIERLIKKKVKIN